ncbi:hypothetical protein [Haloarchaeobius sp. TZWWS8]|uniref:hypothetical protein n=1 Tax=Haloarchaeobius sp. TZWWS8 TaxID=3446121 RepID=UPI003EB70F61
MPTSPPSRAEQALVLLGSILTAYGSYGPWVRVNPTLPPDAAVPTIGLFKMWPGFTPLDWLPVAAALLGTLAVGRNWHARRRWGLSAGAGLLTCTWGLYYGATMIRGYSVLAPFSGTFVPTPQWYLTLLGGLLLLGNGLRRLARMRLTSRTQPREPTAE